MARLLVVSRSMALALRLADSHEVVEHAAEALDALDPDGQIDVVVLDVGEPASAVSVLDTLRRRGNAVPVLIVSGYQPAWAGLAALDLPGVVVVPLPITRTALLTGIERLESGRRARSGVPLAGIGAPLPFAPPADELPTVDAPAPGSSASIPAPFRGPGLPPPGYYTETGQPVRTSSQHPAVTVLPLPAAVPTAGDEPVDESATGIDQRADVDVEQPTGGELRAPATGSPSFTADPDPGPTVADPDPDPTPDPPPIRSAGAGLRDELAAPVQQHNPFTWWPDDDGRPRPADLFVPARPISPHEALTEALDLTALEAAIAAASLRADAGPDEEPSAGEDFGAPAPSAATDDDPADHVRTDDGLVDHFPDADDLAGHTPTDHSRPDDPLTDPAYADDVLTARSDEFEAALPVSTPAEPPSLGLPVAAVARPAVVDLPIAFLPAGEAAVDWLPVDRSAAPAPAPAPEPAPAPAVDVPAIPPAAVAPAESGPTAEAYLPDDQRATPDGPLSFDDVLFGLSPQTRRAAATARHASGEIPLPVVPEPQPPAPAPAPAPAPFEDVLATTQGATPPPVPTDEATPLTRRGLRADILAEVFPGDPRPQQPVPVDASVDASVDVPVYAQVGPRADADPAPPEQVAPRNGAQTVDLIDTRPDERAAAPVGRSGWTREQPDADDHWTPGTPESMLDRHRAAFGREAPAQQPSALQRRLGDHRLSTGLSTGGASPELVALSRPVENSAPPAWAAPAPDLRSAPPSGAPVALPPPLSAPAVAAATLAPPPGGHRAAAPLDRLLAPPRQPLDTPTSLGTPDPIPPPPSGPRDAAASHVTLLVGNGFTGDVLDPTGLHSNPLDRNPLDPDPLDPDPLDRNPLDPDPLDRNPLDRNPLDRNPLDSNPVDSNPLDSNPPTDVRFDGLLPAAPAFERRSAPSIRELVRALNERSLELFGVADTCQVLAQDVVEHAGADAAAIIVPDGSVWRVNGGVGLRPIERRLVLDAGHWLVTEVAIGGRALVVDDPASLRPRLDSAPLAGWEHLLAVPVPDVMAVVVVARSRTGRPFTQDDLAALARPVQEAAGLLSAATATRRLARALAPLTEDDGT